MTSTFYVYDDSGRVARAVTESPWTEEDRALMLAYRMFLDSICDGCGQPKSLAHHPDNDGWYEVAPQRVICHACTAIRRVEQEGSKEPVKPVELIRLVHDRDYSTHPLPPLRLDRDLA